MNRFIRLVLPVMASLVFSAAASAATLSGKVERVYISDHPNGNYMFAMVQNATGGSLFCYHVGQGSDMGAAMMDAYTAQTTVSMSCDNSSLITNFYSIRGF